MLAVKSPYLNWEGTPEIPVTLEDIFVNSPAGKKSPTVGFIISWTNAVTSFVAAAPITNAIANPIIPNTFRKSKNCLMNDFDGSGGESAKFY